MFTRINQTQQHPRTMGYRIHGAVAASEVEAVGHEIEESLDENDEVNLLVQVDDDAAYADAHAFWEDFKTGLKRMKDLNRMAVVTDKPGFEKATEAAELAPGLDVRHFHNGEEKLAWRWVATGDTKPVGHGRAA